jgi:hypothetical protein
MLGFTFWLYLNRGKLRKQLQAPPRHGPAAQ